MSFGIGLSRVFMGFILMDGMQLIELDGLIVASGRLLYKCFKFFFLAQIHFMMVMRLQFVFRKTCGEMTNIFCLRFPRLF